MEYRAVAAGPDDVLAWREMYRMEMDCQIIHDSIHRRPGWTREYVLYVGGTSAGYGSVAVAGPWSGQPTVYEFFVVSQQRRHVFDLFGVLLEACGATMIEVQSNDPLATVMVHSFAADVTSESILFRDMFATSHAPQGATFREPTADEAPDVSTERLRWHGVVEVDGGVAAKGGILFHYNPPYGDIFMDVDETYRRRGLGTFLVQELKRICYEGGHVPAARCRPDNVPSRKTLLNAGFIPCGHILKGRLL